MQDRCLLKIFQILAGLSVVGYSDTESKRSKMLLIVVLAGLLWDGLHPIQGAVLDDSLLNPDERMIRREDLMRALSLPYIPCRPDAFPNLRIAGFCSDTANLDAICDGLEVSVSASACTRVQGAFCCYISLSQGNVLTSVPSTTQASTTGVPTVPTTVPSNSSTATAPTTRASTQNPSSVPATTTAASTLATNPTTQVTTPGGGATTVATTIVTNTGATTAGTTTVGGVTTPASTAATTVPTTAVPSTTAASTTRPSTQNPSTVASTQATNPTTQATTTVGGVSTVASTTAVTTGATTAATTTPAVTTVATVPTTPIPSTTAASTTRASTQTTAATTVPTTPVPSTTVATTTVPTTPVTSSTAVTTPRATTQTTNAPTTPVSTQASTQVTTQASTQVTTAATTAATTAPIPADCVNSLNPACPNVRQQILDLLNAERRVQGAADMLKLVWDDKAAQAAQTWADQCSYLHGPENPNRPSTNFNKTGQNIGRGYTSWTDLINDWNKERQFVKVGQACPTPSDTLQYLHWTQDVWSKTWQIGCGFHALCPANPALRVNQPQNFLVCNFGPEGNRRLFGGDDSDVCKMLYTPGTQPNGGVCGKCGGQGSATCPDGLCTNGCRFQNDFDNPTCDSLIPATNPTFCQNINNQFVANCTATCNCRGQNLIY